MSNKKTIIGSAAAIVASVALIGGGTFAAWSDFDVVEGQEVGAGQLVIAVDEAASTFALDSLAPGETMASVIEVDSPDSTVDGVLSLSFDDFSSTEDGCSNTNSEEAAETDFASDFDNPTCRQVVNGANGTPGGQLPDFAVLELAYADPDPAPAPGVDPCNAGLFEGGTPVPTSVDIISLGSQTFDSELASTATAATAAPQTLRDAADEDALEIGNLAADDTICVYVAVHMPMFSTDSQAPISLAQNAAMGDEAGFSLRFLLEQDVTES